MRFCRSIAFRLPKRLRQGGPRTLYPWLSLAAAILGLIVSGLTWFAVSHRESELAKLELSSQGSGYALTLQFGIDAYLRRVAGLRAATEDVISPVYGLGLKTDGCSLRPGTPIQRTSISPASEVLKTLS
jgi:hypothetical protein